MASKATKTSKTTGFSFPITGGVKLHSTRKAARRARRRAGASVQKFLEAHEAGFILTEARNSWQYSFKGMAQDYSFVGSVSLTFVPLIPAQDPTFLIQAVQVQSTLEAPLVPEGDPPVPSSSTQEPTETKPAGAVKEEVGPEEKEEGALAPDSAPSTDEDPVVDAITLEEDYFPFLDELKDAGSINMLDAGLNLTEKFGLDAKEAKVILGKWMTTYAQRHPSDE